MKSPACLQGRAVAKYDAYGWDLCLRCVQYCMRKQCQIAGGSAGQCWRVTCWSRSVLGECVAVAGYFFWGGAGMRTAGRRCGFVGESGMLPIAASCPRSAHSPASAGRLHIQSQPEREVWWLLSTADVSQRRIRGLWITKCHTSAVRSETFHGHLLAECVPCAYGPGHSPNQYNRYGAKYACTVLGPVVTFLDPPPPGASHKACGPLGLWWLLRMCGIHPLACGEGCSSAVA